MIKTTVAALIAAVALSSVAVPAFAATDGIFGSGDYEAKERAANSIVTLLNQQGVNATAVEEWNGLVRAYVTTEDGGQIMQFFTPGSLNQVTL